MDVLKMQQTQEISPPSIADFNAQWDKVRQILKAELGDDIYSSWFGRVEFEAFNNGEIILSVPTRFLQKWLKSHYADKMLTCWKREVDTAASLRLDIRNPGGLVDSSGGTAASSGDHIATTNIRQFSEGSSQTAYATQDAVVGGSTQAHPSNTQENAGTDDFEGSPLDARFSFDSFVVGSSNQMGHAAAVQVSNNVLANDLRYNPLFIHAGVGLGKTHLLHAISWRVKQRCPGARVLYLTAERFMYSFVEALRAKNALAFKDKLRRIDLLLVDDMEFLQGKVTQEEFGHTLNWLIDGGQQVVVAADRAPGKLDNMDTRMRSRLAGGLVVELGMLDDELRIEILRKRVKEEASRHPGLAVPGIVLEFLASKLKNSGRELEGAITRLLAAWQLTAQPITVASTEHVIRDLVSAGDQKRIKIDDIMRTISRHYGVNRNDLLSARRTRSIVRPRQIGMYLSKHLTERSLPEIGRQFGGRDHTTVIHAIRKVDELMKGSNELREEVEMLKRTIRD
jgi:chromosomal replication initiator protein